MNHCEWCGTESSESDEYCHWCGEDFDESDREYEAQFGHEYL